MFSSLVQKVFKLKKLVVEPKTAQPDESDKEAVDPQLNRSRGAKKNTFSLFQNGYSTSQPPPQPVEVWSRGDQGPTITCQVVNANS